MKKIYLLFSITLCFIMALGLTSCSRKNESYKVCGLYIELVEQEEISIDDNNPKVYFKNTGLATKAVPLKGQTVSFTNRFSSVPVKDGIRTYYFKVDLILPAEIFENYNIKLIIYEDGKYVVSNQIVKNISKFGNCEYTKELKYNNEEYNVEFILGIKERG